VFPLPQTLNLELGTLNPSEAERKLGGLAA
jgi:hypothetical protein